MATAVGEEDDVIARPDIIIVLDLQDESAVCKRCDGRRVDPDTGDVYHIDYNRPASEEVLDKLIKQSGDGDDAAVKPRYEAHIFTTVNTAVTAAQCQV
eukprot:11166-Heterococcus_DN1.PRE.3